MNNGQDELNLTIKQPLSNITFNKDWQQIIEIGASEFGVKLTQEQLDFLTFHANELIKWNKKFNITAIVDPFDVALKHFIDSIAIAPLISDGSKLIDLGSGGGFPGMVLKVIKPSCDVFMADSSQKKVNFLNYLITQTSLSRIIAVHARAEALGKEKGYANQFDFVISRAFTALNRFTEMALALLKDGGTIIAMKGELKSEELAPIINQKDLNVKVSEYLLPFERHKRCVVIIRHKISDSL
ncbi:MAG: 16S rRNA (guanine(527)-N(7))-methyltransferase RsmG [Desulfamplus sp.]|nr:16S rRNA (guanine(527)-N(7))-methyltransferase RsmG [Desulfamplus sp.]